MRTYQNTGENVFTINLQIIQSILYSLVKVLHNIMFFMRLITFHSFHVN